jgi:hypothetical protein
MAQAIDSLPSNHKALTLSSSTAGRKEGRKEGWEGREEGRKEILYQLHIEMIIF